MSGETVTLEGLGARLMSRGSPSAKGGEREIHMTDNFEFVWRERVEQNLGTHIANPRHRRAWIEWERQNLARDIADAQRRGASGEAQRLRYYAWRLWQESISLEGPAA
jgi:hypothetical protein